MQSCYTFLHVSDAPEIRAIIDWPCKMLSLMFYSDIDTMDQLNFLRETQDVYLCYAKQVLYGIFAYCLDEATLK